jgi:hypothetical protein
LIAELCPDGWEKSPLFACYHPAPEVLYEEHRRFSMNLKSLFVAKKRRAEKDSPAAPEEPEPTFEEFLAKHPPQPQTITPETAIQEPAELLGLCLWDIFSDNHDVIAADGRIVHLGSFRGSAGMISDFFESSSRDKSGTEHRWDGRGYGYLDFYMGTSWVSRRADLTPAYELIFRKLHAVGTDWSYAFPRIHLIDFGPRESDPDLPYDPSAALQQEAEHKARAEETAKMRKQLDRDVKAAKRKARTAPPPTTVRAYQNIYHRFPRAGHPIPTRPIDSSGRFLSDFNKSRPELTHTESRLSL